MRQNDRRFSWVTFHVIGIILLNIFFTTHSYADCELKIKLNQGGTYVCTGDETPLNFSVTELSGAEDVVYHWSYKEKGVNEWHEFSSTGNEMPLLPSVLTEYKVYAEKDGCHSNTEVFSLSIREGITLQLPTDTVVCKGANITIKDVVVSGNPTRFYWDGEESDQPNHSLIKISDDMTLTLSATDGYCTSKELHYDITVREPITFTLTPDQTICKGEEASIRVRLRTGNATAYKYYKQVENGIAEEFVPEGRNLYETPEKTTTYTITVESDACPSVTQQTTVFVEQPQKLSLSITDNIERTCKGSEISFDLETENCEQLRWEMTPTSTMRKKILGVGTEHSKSIVLDESAYFRVVSLKEGVCPQEASNEITVYVDDPLRLKIKPMVKNFCTDDEIHLEADLYSGSTDNLGWSKIVGNSTSEISHELTGSDKATESAKYVVWAKSPSCPTATDTVEITVENSITPTINASTSTLCAGEELTLNGTYGDAVALKWQRRDAGEPVFKTISTDLSGSIKDTPQKDATYCLVTTGLSACPEKWSEQIQVTVEKPAELSLEAPKKICKGETTIIKANTDGNPNQIQWEKINSFGTKTLQTSTQKVRETINETTTFVIKSTSDLCPNTTDSITIEVEEIPEFQATASTDSICEGEELTLSTDFPHAENIKWEKAQLTRNTFTTISEGEQEVTISPMESAKYRVSIETEAGCKVQSNPIIVNFSRHITSHLGDTLVCEGEELDLSHLIYSAYNYEWATDPSFQQTIPNEEMKVFSPKESKTYYVRIKNGACKKEFPINIEIVSHPNIVDAEIVGYHNIHVTADGGSGSYLYNFGHGFGESDVFEHARYSTTYHIQVKDAAAGCLTDTTITTPDCIIEIPIFFTPNGDGINDLYIVKNLDKFLVYKLRIYDRYGKFLYQQDETNGPWDGTYLGHPMPSTDYWYTLDIEEEDEEHAGHFTLLR